MNEFFHFPFFMKSNTEFRRIVILVLVNSSMDMHHGYFICCYELGSFCRLGIYDLILYLKKTQAVKS